MDQCEEVNYPQGIAGYAVIGQYTGDNKSPPWVGPVKPTRAEAAKAYYDRACEYRNLPDADKAMTELAQFTQQLVAEAATVTWDGGMEILSMVKVPL